MTKLSLPQLDERVLSTLNADGSRRWMDPRLVRGRWWKRRLAVAVTLIGVFTALPWLRFAGKPPILLDLIERQFTVLGNTFRPTETLFLALVALAVLVSIGLMTALFGRVWCGWACPQTVYLEFVYRPLERWILGHAHGRAAPASLWRRLALYAAYLVLSAHLANTFLAYFVGTDRLVEWTLGNPAAHPVAFGVFAVVTAAMLFDFVFFREQLCTLVCPYGRMQSVLLDRSSLIVAYDRPRGEPRARAIARKGSDAPAGDCIDCTLCVQSCPTGIDIRDGLQLECIHCTQCIDACDGVMRRVGRQEGLIRYASQESIEGQVSARVRPRTILYPLLLAAVLSVLAIVLVRRSPVLVEQERMVGQAFVVEASGRVVSTVKLLVENRGHPGTAFVLEGADGVDIKEPVAIEVAAGHAVSVEFPVMSEPEDFHRGTRRAVLHVVADDGSAWPVTVSIPGPFGVGGDGAAQGGRP
jgi:cytochrome c oxidase accessory protein FixG